MTIQTVVPSGLCDLFGQLMPIRSVFGGFVSKIEVTRVGNWGLRVSAEDSPARLRMHADGLPRASVDEQRIFDPVLREAGVGAVDIEVHRDGFVWRQRVEDSAPVPPLRKGERSDRSGVTWTFWPTDEWVDFALRQEDERRIREVQAAVASRA